VNFKDDKINQAQMNNCSLVQGSAAASGTRQDGTSNVSWHMEQITISSDWDEIQVSVYSKWCYHTDNYFLYQCEVRFWQNVAPVI